MRPWDCSGGHEFTSRGLERQLGTAIIGMLRLLKGCPTSWTLRSPTWPEGYLRGSRGTPNHRFGTRIAYYIWALMAGSKEQIADARALVADFFDQQAVSDGHMLGEIMTTSHAQIWYYEVMAVRAVALHFLDQEIIEKSGRWLRMDYYLLDLVAFDGVPRSPGARPAGIHNPLRTAMLSLYSGWPCPPLPKGWGNPNVATNPFWSNTYSVGAWVARELIRDGDDLGGTRSGKREKALLRDPMYVWRRGDDYVISIPHFTKSGPEVLPWISRIGGVEKEAPIFRGQLRDWDSPSQPPELPRATLIVVSGT